MNAVETTTPVPSKQDIFSNNVKEVLHAIIGLLPLRFEREVEIFHNAVDKIDTAVGDLFTPVATIAAPAAESALQVEVDDLKKMVQQLLAAQGVSTTSAAPAPVETPVAAPVETAVTPETPVTAPVETAVTPETPVAAPVETAVTPDAIPTPAPIVTPEA